MILFVISCILALIAAGTFLWGAFGKDTYGNSVKYLMGWALVPLALSVIFGIWSTVYTQDPGEAVVIRSVSGKVTNIDTTPGFGFKAPWSTKIDFNVRNQRIEMFKNEGGEGADGAGIRCPLTGSANADVSITVRYSIDPSAVQSIYELHRSQDNLLANLLRPGLRDETRNACANYTPFLIKEQRAQLGTDIEALLAERWADTGVRVDGVDLGDINLDPGTEEAIVRVNAATLEVEAAQERLKQSRVQAEVTKTVAKADSDADQIIRCGADIQEVTQTVNGEEATTIVVTPKTEADCENRLNQQVLTTKWIEALREVGKNGNTILVVPNDPTGGLSPIINLPQPTTPATPTD